MSLNLNPSPAAVYIIGAGGIGGQLLSTLLLTLKQAEHQPVVIVVDGDTVEHRNLDRQFFTERQVGVNKAKALVEKAGYFSINFVPEYFAEGFDVLDNSLFFCCVDNHPARRAVLATIDRTSGFGIFGGNEYTDEEAYFYSHVWKGTEIDPRVYYPSILTDQAGDPMTALIGCTGEAQAAAPQLAIANKMAAAYMLKLFWFYFVESNKLDRESQPVWPIRFSSNFSRCTTARRSEFTKPPVVETT